jgi:hypothetical protein
MPAHWTKHSKVLHMPAPKYQTSLKKFGKKTPYLSDEQILFVTLAPWTGI